jgi:CheY-like chemotaxis protein
MSPESPQTTPPTGKRILVVEDESIVRRTVTHLLTEHGYDVIGAVDGSEAVTQAQNMAPDLIVLDLGLPQDPFAGANFDGFGVMQWLNRRLEGHAIPVVVLTARQDAESRRRAIELGASVYLTKPFKPGDLIEAIRVVLGEA